MMKYEISVNNEYSKIVSVFYEDKHTVLWFLAVLSSTYHVVNALNSLFGGKLNLSFNCVIIFCTLL